MREVGLKVLAGIPGVDDEDVTLAGLIRENEPRMNSRLTHLTSRAEKWEHARIGTNALFEEV